MDEIDKSVFKIPGFENAETSNFDAKKETVVAVASEAVIVEPAATNVVAENITPIESKDIVPKEIIVKKEVDQNFYNELTAISEEILECRSKILEHC
ncbi:MAG: hypothetical protein ACK5MU_01220 [Candidatus Saccharimonadales bacterium]